MSGAIAARALFMVVAGPAAFAGAIAARPMARPAAQAKVVMVDVKRLIFANLRVFICAAGSPLCDKFADPWMNNA